MTRYWIRRNPKLKLSYIKETMKKQLNIVVWHKFIELLLKISVQDLDLTAVLLLRHYGAKNLRDFKEKKLNAEEIIKAKEEELTKNKDAFEKELHQNLRSSLAITKTALNHRPKKR